MMRHSKALPRRKFIRTSLIWVPAYVLGKRLVDAAENVKAVGATAKANIKNVGTVAEANIKAIGPVDNTGGATCDTARDASSGADNSGASNLEIDWYGTDFTAAASTTICRADLIMEKDGTPPASTLVVAIYTATGTPGEPGTQVGTASGGISIATLPDAAGTVSFTGLSAAITATTRYFVVLKFSARGTTGNVGVWRNWDPVDATHETAFSDTGGASWGGELGDTWSKFTLYSN